MSVQTTDTGWTGGMASAAVKSDATMNRFWVLRQREGRSPEVTDSVAWERYLPYEFPSLVSSAGYARHDSAEDSLERLFAAEVGRTQGVEAVYVRKDRDYYRVWTVLNEPDVAIEDSIYEAQLRFMDQLDLPCDFSIIFRQGKDPGSLWPVGASRLYP